MVIEKVKDMNGTLRITIPKDIAIKKNIEKGDYVEFIINEIIKQSNENNSNNTVIIKRK